ncbi:PREDICTED: transcription factor MYB59-like [Tarenaya hassleriana]|uniref:transcription factor MYB59-like n=2 Tax=Tarenaya hassleriana TaxID=28532 RepID=UPI00053C6EDF|nr:PREDICTED: transcription factor MYB59-like [Tarenaya hassleriana]
MRKMKAKKEEIKKGPWKAEEDEVLINHVKKYGPRDWSSIRSKGLLLRTGKSCRLRWVNKLRPNLKNGCKFSAEEERTVIELQAQFGNKWARIATYLPGRTDNDVKNFWSSRQKRLARILHNSSGESSSRPHKFNSARSGGDSVGSSEIPGFGFVGQEMSASSSKIVLPCSSAYLDASQPVETLAMPDLGIKLETHPFAFGTDFGLMETSLFTETQQLPQPQSSIQFSPDSQELLSRMDDHCFYDILGPCDSAEQFSLPQPFFEPPRSRRHVGRDEPDVFLDDFPSDMFDQADPLHSNPFD